MASAPFLTLLLLTTAMELVRARLKKPQLVALIGLLLPLASVAIYRNSFPYYYAFILPPAMIGAAVAAKALATRFPAHILAIAFVANAVVISIATPRAVLDTQRQVVAAVDEIFPEPVHYFDFPGMIVDFPKANFFMTTWGMKNYLTSGNRAFSAALAEKTVPLLILNQPPLEINQSGPEPAPYFFPEDGKALREGFIPHWGPLWVAGRHFPTETGDGEFRIYTPGTYTLEGGAARIDGEEYAAGQTLTLQRGMHEFERIGTGERTLRWGDRLERPSEDYVGGPVLKDF
jgi:hypothetical protein